MRIRDMRVLHGPNVHHHKPVLVMSLHLEELTERESCDVPGFVERLLDRLPGVAMHHCSRGREGGFVERLCEGTYFGHVVEHVALELAGLLGSPVTYGKTRYAGEPGLYHVVVRYRSEPGMRMLLRTSVELVDALVRDVAYDLAAALAAARERIDDTELGPSTRAIVDAASERGIPWRRVDDTSLVQLGYGKHRTWIRAALTSRTSNIAVEMASDKQRTKAVLAEAGVPVPRGVVVDTAGDALRAWLELGERVAVKPLDGNQGRGVSADVTTPQELAKAFAEARAIAPEVIVEEHVQGNDYRVLVVGGTLVAASRRAACHVVGDGVSTVRSLVDAANRDPARGTGHEKPLTRIVVDDMVLSCLGRHGWSLESVPAVGESIVLRQNANLSQGGTACDVTDDVHPNVRRACERAARAIGLDVCGVDLLAVDIRCPTGFSVIEVNAAPGLRMHLHPTEGRARPVGRAILELLYPPGASGRIPIAAITGTNGKTTVTRLVGHALSGRGVRVGMTTTDGIWVDGVRIAEGDTTGPASARTVLDDPTVETAVLETARGGILRRGLGYDWSDVAVITNIQADHLGQDGIEDLDDLIWIKSLVAERVRPGGTLVLNADDPATDVILERRGVAGSGATVTLFSASDGGPRMGLHVAGGGVGIGVVDGWLVEMCRERRQRIAPLAAIGIVFAGTAAHQVANCAAAAAAARALGCTTAEIARALRTFDAAGANPGRANLFAHGSGRILVDYGHNPEAIRATCAMIASWGRLRIGIVGAPGDRDDALIEQVALAAAAGFDRIVIREDDDRRGRPSGEVAELLWRTVRAAAPEKDCRVVLDEREALTGVLNDVGSGALAVHFYSELDPVLALLEQVGAKPAGWNDAGPDIPDLAAWPLRRGGVAG